MTTTADLQRQINDVQRDLRDLQRESIANVGLLAAFIRRTRIGLSALEQEQSIRRTHSPIGLLDWTPRQGEFADPNLATSLIDRLRAGNPVADSMGSQPGLYPGLANLLSPIDSVAVVAPGASFAPLVRAIDASGGDTTAFEVQRVSGSSFGSVSPANDRASIAAGGFHSSALSLFQSFSGAGSVEWLIRSWAVDALLLGGGAFQYPFLVASVVVVPDVGNDSLTSSVLTLEIRNDTTASIVASATFDLKTATAYVPRLLYVATAALSAAQRDDQYRWQLRLATTAAGVDAAGARIFEPLLINHPSPDPVLYNPQVATFLVPPVVGNLVDAGGSLLVRGAYTGDTEDRVNLDTDGVLQRGPGGATVPDLRERRSAAKTRELDDGAGGPAKDWLRGDAVQILGASFTVTYDGSGRVTQVDRSGAQGTAQTVVTYSGSQVASVATTRGGKTVTITPTYTGPDITGLARAVA